MNSGKVKFYNETKGYGFIMDDESDKEYFVHATGLVDKIKDDDLVVYDLENGNRGFKAVNVKRSK